MAAILVGLNAASYTQKEKTLDSESEPNRSTFNAGATGTAAYYSLLLETGRNVIRWQEPTAALLTAKTAVPSVFVMTGALRREYTAPEVEQLLSWVSSGGRLVITDREPPGGLVTTTANWKISLESNEHPEIYTVDATDQMQMTFGTSSIKPVQPTVFTQSVNAVQPSRFAATVVFEHFTDAETQSYTDDEKDAIQPPETQISPIEDDGLYTMPTEEPVQMLPMANVESPSQIAPVVHFAAGDKNLVVEVPFGEGRIVYLSDPYIVSNGGISLVDNAQLAINLVAAGDGIVAFDEYHQGFGTDSNRFLQFFAGTPVIAIFLQAAVLIGLVFFSQSRRFARPVPEAEPDRLSKLEYVAAMAELQRRTKAYDLAIENIYNEFRRRVTRYFGLDNITAKNIDLAAMIAERGGLDPAKVEDTLYQCEEIIRGGATNKREVLRLTADLRSIEQQLGMTRAGRNRV